MGLQWREQLSVGNDLIDTDHQYLIDVVNRAEASMKAHNRIELTAVLEELERYAQTHFKREELVAKAVGYPGVDNLHESHARLVTTLVQFKEEVGIEWSDAAVTQFTSFLRDWLIGHVIKEDLPMKPWMLKHSPRFDPRN
ncbi:MAG: hypothetical protein CO065_04160 [Comamonadaceae bacterium CG_4_9_14_0_8_um_filter_57_21]|nr:MAG: hypothetical protein CO065_04160 [Comamonadaceae bacterium CG_4_9_14_0_8_um_filter_57_21]